MTAFVHGMESNESTLIAKFEIGSFGVQLAWVGSDALAWAGVR